MADARRQKIAHYEELLNEGLKGELQEVLDRRDRVYERISHWCALPSLPCRHPSKSRSRELSLAAWSCGTT